MTASHQRPSITRETLGSLLRMERPILRIQLAALYTGLFLCLLIIVLGATGLLLIHSSQSETAGGPAPTPGPSASVLLILGIGAVATVLAATGAWWLAGRFLRPLRSIAAAADEISATNLHRRLELTGPDDELTHLANTLNSLFSRLETSFESQRRFVANASHELRTPLTGQRAVLQVALGDPNRTAESLSSACEQVLALADQQQRLIDALLTLATSDRGLDQREAFDLAELAATVIDGHSQLAEAREIAIRSSLASAPTNGDARLVRLLLGNLIDNAVRYNSPGGTVTVQTSSRAANSVLTVVNTGALVPEDSLAHLFEPFRTARADRTHHADGHGLGLAIVQAIAQAHATTIDAKARPTGGLEITVAFRRLDPPAEQAAERFRARQPCQPQQATNPLHEKSGAIFQP